MSKYITPVQRYKIETMLKDGCGPKQIALRLGKHYTTIYKEIAKGTVTLMNSDLTYRTEYCADAAQRITDERQKNKGRCLKIGHDHELAAHIEYLIGKLHYSPYAVVCDIRKSGRYQTDICKTTLYSYIDMGLFLNISNADLYSKRHRRKKSHNETTTRPSHKNLRAKGIEERPKEADTREVSGHWEMDTVCSGRRKSPACILALTERRGRTEHLCRMPDKTLHSTVRALDRIERAIGFDAFCKRFKTITVDNGSEFSDSSLLERSCLYPDRKRTSVYYCHPYRSSERGSNENANKLIRHWIPKGGDIGRYSDDDISMICDWMNHYPRQLFGGLSSAEYVALTATD